MRLHMPSTTALGIKLALIALSKSSGAVTVVKQVEHLGVHAHLHTVCYKPV